MRTLPHWLSRLNGVRFRPRFDIVVVIPARNEEERIEACLRSVLIASERVTGIARRIAIIVVADSCTDQTVGVARATLGSRPYSAVVTCDFENVARTRAHGVAVGRSVLETDRPSRTWLANTDADTTVPPNWLRLHLDAARRNVHAIAGIVEVHSFDGLPAAARQYFRNTYTATLPVDGDHTHVHAANLGVRLDAYNHAGGWGSLPRSEDRDLWTRLRRSGARIESPTSLRVVTSGRGVGRVPGGFAECLRQQVYAWEHRDVEIETGIST